MQDSTADELELLRFELRQDIALQQQIEQMLLLLMRVRSPDDMSFGYRSACAKWLRQCKQEVCELEKVFDRAFISRHLQRELDRFGEWLIPYLPTDKMAVPQVSLLLRQFDYEADTDKTQALKKVASNGSN